MPRKSGIDRFLPSQWNRKNAKPRKTAADRVRATLAKWVREGKLRTVYDPETRELRYFRVNKGDKGIDKGEDPKPNKGG